MVDMIPMVNREKIRYLRKDVLKLTLEEASKRAGFATLRRWDAVETGDTESPPIDTVAAIAKVLGTTIDELME